MCARPRPYVGGPQSRRRRAGRRLPAMATGSRGGGARDRLPPRPDFAPTPHTPRRKRSAGPVRPAPDPMTFLTGFLPVAQGVEVHAALRRHAQSLHGQGDPRTVAQIMADTLVARCTGRERASGTPVEIQVVMTERTLLETTRSPRGWSATARSRPGWPDDWCGRRSRPGTSPLSRAARRAVCSGWIQAAPLRGQASSVPDEPRRLAPVTVVRRTSGTSSTRCRSLAMAEPRETTAKGSAALQLVRRPGCRRPSRATP